MNSPRLESDGEAAVELFRRRARTFSLAAKLLPAQTADCAARLYEFCRFVDDLADDAPQERAIRAIGRVAGDVRRGASAIPVVQRFIRLCEDAKIDRELGESFIYAAFADIRPATIQTTGELIRYAYGVASTVGLMMCPILGATDQRAKPFAIDLGVGMQITNVVRDLREDALRGRVYLPSNAVTAFRPRDVLDANSGARAAVLQAMMAALKTADRYYDSANRGLRFIPPASRAAIAVAARVYQEIGNQIRLDPDGALARRAHVSAGRKAFLSMGVLRRIATSQCNDPPRHDRRLHEHLVGLWGADAQKVDRIYA